MEQTRATRWPQPFVGMREIGWADVLREAAAGITLAALIIPLNIGFAQVAGLPPVVGVVQALIVAVACAIVPYVLFRGPTARLARVLFVKRHDATSVTASNIADDPGGETRDRSNE